MLAARGTDVQCGVVFTPTPVQLQELVDTVAATTGAPTTLEDRDLNLVASSGHDDVIDEVRRTSILSRRSSVDVQRAFAAFGIAQAEEPLRIPGDGEAGRLARWCVPVRWRRVTYGYLWLLDPEGSVAADVLPGLRDVVEQIAAALALRARTGSRTSWAVGELLSPPTGARAPAIDELRRDGLLPAHDSLVVAALAPSDGSPVGSVNAWLLPHGVLSGQVGQRGALVVPVTDARRAADVADRAARNLLAQHPEGVAAGVSGPVPVLDAHTGWRQADAALRVAVHCHGDGQRDLRRDGQGEVTLRSWADLGVLRLLTFGAPSTLAAAVADERARRLLDGDADLRRTARTYLDPAGSAHRTAAALAIHRQTLYHRLRRIADLTGYDLDDGADRLALHLTLTLAELEG